MILRCRYTKGEMTKNMRKLIIVVFFFFFFFFFFLDMGKTFAFAQEVAVIANPSAPTLTREDIRALYLGFKTTLPDGTPAEVFILKEDGVLEKFLREVIGISKGEFEAHWLSKALSGEGVPPRELSPEEIIARVKENKGAIGIVPLDMVTEDVKVVLEIR